MNFDDVLLRIVGCLLVIVIFLAIFILGEMAFNPNFLFQDSAVSVQIK